jgi:AbrB family looped-hinge helix DNA binding protein
MPQLVTITQQGQISIPAQLRQALGLNKYRKALVSRDKNRIVIEPVSDLLSLGGSLQHRVLKNKTSKQIRQLEQQATQDGFAGK